MTTYKQPITSVTGTSLLRELHLLEFGVATYEMHFASLSWWQFSKRKEYSAILLMFKFRLECFEDMLTRLEIEE